MMDASAGVHAAPQGKGQRERQGSEEALFVLEKSGVLVGGEGVAKSVEVTGEDGGEPGGGESLVAAVGEVVMADGELGSECLQGHLYQVDQVRGAGGMLKRLES
jgi:hypothetical protein